MGPAARGIVRLSGPDALMSLDAWFEPADADRWRTARSAGCHAGKLRLEALGSALEVTIYVWPNARSYTGQPLVEIHTFGSSPLLEAILARAFEAGARSAQPGEFTLRAFLAGRIDLLQAEAVLGVIDARGEEAFATALRQLAGGISGRMGQVRGELIDLLADLEAGLDFVEDGIEFVPRDEVTQRIRQSERVIDGLLRRCQTRAQSLGRYHVVLAGLPNAGKSTLFNALLARDAAIVSPVAGTTRDYLSGSLQWQGLAVELIDTPGWDPGATDGLSQGAERGGQAFLTSRSQELGAQQRQQADLILWCSPVDAGEAQRLEDTRVRSRELDSGRPIVVVGTKADLSGRRVQLKSDAGEVLVSAKTGQGLAELVDRCVQVLSAAAFDSAEIIGTTAVRCRESLASCRDALVRAADAAESEMGDEIVALELREALEHLGRVLGTVYTDDILDRIFSRFCIGK